MPAIVSEIILGIFVYKFIGKKSIVWAMVAEGLILFNLAFIFNSAVWGQIDGLFSLMLMLTIYFLSEKKLILSSIYFGLAFLIKPQAIALLPIFGLFLIKNISIKNILQLFLPFFVIIFSLSLPFFIAKPLAGLPQLFSKMVSDYPYISLFAYNFWGMIGFWVSDGKMLNYFSYQTLGYFLFSGYWLIICYLYFKKKLSLYALSALAFLGFYFLPTRIHERYLYQAIVFLIIFASIVKSKLLIGLTAILSIIHFLNLYYVYVYYNEIYLKLPKILYDPLIYNFLDSSGKIMSIISTILFILISLVIIKSYAISEKV